MKVISRDPFARQTLVRQQVEDMGLGCRECGGTNHHGKLYKYGTARDDRNNVDWELARFCSKSCRDSYYS